MNKANLRANVISKPMACTARRNPNIFKKRFNFGKLLTCKTCFGICFVHAAQTHPACLFMEAVNVQYFPNDFLVRHINRSIEDITILPEIGLTEGEVFIPNQKNSLLRL